MADILLQCFLLLSGYKHLSFTIYESIVRTYPATELVVITARVFDAVEL